LKTEDLAYWYLRLNGCLTTANFVVHPDLGRNQRTDVDVLAVRFPHRAENVGELLEDDSLFTSVTDRPFLVLAEAKASRCALNGPWTRRADGNMERVLSAAGVVPKPQILSVADALYDQGRSEIAECVVSLLCLGSEVDPALAARLPRVPQVTWYTVLKFIHHRFKRFKFRKVAHPQWDETGRLLWSTAIASKTVEIFASSIRLT